MSTGYLIAKHFYKYFYIIVCKSNYSDIKINLHYRYELLV